MKNKIILLLFFLGISSLFLFGQKKPNVGKFEVHDFNDTIVESGSSGCFVYVSFIVNQEGKLNQIKVDSYKCDSNKRYIRSIKKEAVRVVKSMPDWKPIIKDGKPVRVKYILPIKFENELDTIN